MSKPIAKITVYCPHCGAEQQEPELAKSTFCRRCSEHFAITPATLQPAKPAVAPPIATQKSPALTPAAPGAKPVTPAASEPSQGLGFKDRIDHFFGKPRNRIARCFECDASHEVSSSAHSSTCRVCGAYIDLQDYKITGSFSRNIVTRGTVLLSSKGDLSSSRIVCDAATLQGKMRGNIQCFGKLTLRLQGKVPGTLEAGMLILEKGTDIVAPRPIKAAQVEISGKLVGQIISTGHVTIFKTGFLEGAVTARGFTVEKGGCFQGELTISPYEAGTAEQTALAEEADGASQRSPVVAPGALLGGETKPVPG